MPHDDDDDDDESPSGGGQTDYAGTYRLSANQLNNNKGEEELDPELQPLQPMKRPDMKMSNSVRQRASLGGLV
jgi:hypothetical protein